MEFLSYLLQDAVQSLVESPTPFAPCMLGGVSSALRLYTPPDPWAGSIPASADRIEEVKNRV